MAKMSNVVAARDICAEARTILGANGILGEYPVMRHMANLESVYTYEGTHDMHLLVVGEAVTGISGVQRLIPTSTRIGASQGRIRAVTPNVSAPNFLTVDS